MNRFSRTAATALIALMALTLPRVGRSDVAPPEGTLTKLEGEACPPAEEVELEDLELQTFGCTAVEVQDLFGEDATSCTYRLVTDCSEVEDGGC